MSSFSARERRKNLIRAAIVKWTGVKPDDINIIYLEGNAADFYKLSVNVFNAKWLTSVSFKLHNNDELETMKSLRKDVKKVFGC